MIVVADHDSRVLARRTFRVKAWDLGAALDWAGERPVKAGFVGGTGRVSRRVTGGGCWASSLTSAGCLSVRATGHLGVGGKTEDLTSDKTDDKDAVLIARLTGQLRR